MHKIPALVEFSHSQLRAPQMSSFPPPGLCTGYSLSWMPSPNCVPDRVLLPRLLWEPRPERPRMDWQPSLGQSHYPPCFPGAFATLQTVPIWAHLQPWPPCSLGFSCRGLLTVLGKLSTLLPQGPYTTESLSLTHSHPQTSMGLIPSRLLLGLYVNVTSEKSSLTSPSTSTSSCNPC